MPSFVAMIYLSIIIPAYNEEKRIKNTLEKILDYLSTRNYTCEIILIDDGSTDRTSDKAREIIKGDRLVIIKNPVNMGKGYSVKNGILSSKGEILLFSDADLSTPIEELDKILLWIEKGYDIVIGSRALPESIIEMPQRWLRHTMGKIFNFLVQVFIINGFKDTQCGFKCFKREAAMRIFELQKLSGFAFDVEILLIARRFGFNIKEAPVRWMNSPKSKVHIIKGSLSMLMELFKILYYWKR
jgi:dolichyl-phosphate beta-glucosyltransferase